LINLTVDTILEATNLIVLLSPHSINKWLN
jgi:hypothetical protein